jgi:hypothetical protein
MKLVNSIFSEGTVKGSFTVSARLAKPERYEYELKKTGSILPEVEDKALGDALFGHKYIDYGILPPAVRWISSDGLVVVFERPPRDHLLSYIPRTRNKITDYDKEKRYVIPLPWTVYVVKFASDYTPYKIFVYTRPNQITSLDDPLSLLPLPNFYSNGELCNPMHGEIEVPNPSLAAGISAAYNRVWNSGFNNDLLEATMIGMRKKAPVHYVVEDAQEARMLVNEQDGFFYNWSKLNILQALDSRFPRPINSGKVEDGLFVEDNDYTINSVIDSISQQYYSKEEFLVNYINTICSM